MKVPMIFRAAALCAIASSPAHAYFINYYPHEADEGASTTLKSWNLNGWNAALSLQPIEDSLISKLGLPASKSADGRYSFAGRNASTDALFSSVAGNDAWRSDIQSGNSALVTTLSNGTSYWQLTRGRADLSDFWLIEFWDTNKPASDKTATGNPTPKPDALTPILQDEDTKLAVSDNPYAPDTVRTPVPEPASLGLMALGLSALAWSRQRVRKREENA